MNLRNLATSAALALTGAALWSYGAKELTQGGQFDYHPNPLGLKMSPYGQVIAMAAQGGISSDWHAVEVAGATGRKKCSCGHDHAEGDHDHTHSQAESTDEKPRGLIATLEEAVTERTNGRPATEAHKKYLRRQIEDRLRTAYELDPSNYANYNSYHLFLTEPQVGTRPILTEKVYALAQATIGYCLQEQSDPRPALTAASASASILELMFFHQQDYSLDQMREELKRLDHSLARHHELTERWLESGEYGRLSPARQYELQERLDFITKIRDAAVRTIERLSKSSREISSRF
jgi:hypothetical protein